MNESRYTMNEPTASVPRLTLVKRLEGEDGFSMQRPAFSSDGRYLAAYLNETKSIRLWDTQTGQKVAEISPEMIFGNQQTVDGLEFSKDGRRIIVFRAGSPLKEINWDTKEIVRNIDLGVNGPRIEDYAFSPDRKWLVLGTPSGIQIWNYEIGEKVSHMLSGEYITSIDVSRDGRFVAFGKRGNFDHSVGIIDMRTKTIDRYPLVNLPKEDQDRIPNYQVRHVSFDQSGNGLLVGYMQLPDGYAGPTGPAGVFHIDLRNERFTGPKELTSTTISFDPVALGRPFNATFVNSFEFSSQGGLSAADVFTPDLKRVKTLTSNEFNAPLLTYRVSPDQQWMAGSFKESDGKVRMRLYQITPEQRFGNPGGFGNTNPNYRYNKNNFRNTEPNW